ncbi:MAG: exodeoxyribonuclease VII small subunit [Bradymonadales bacterium]|jgi:exodeoxyribonuclease VII small subunit
MSYIAPKDYSEASQRLQNILVQIKDENCSIDHLAQYVEEASALILFCKERLASTGLRVEKILEEVKNIQVQATEEIQSIDP